MRILFLIHCLFLCSCVHFPANQTFYRIGKDGKGGNKAIPAFANSGDLVGNVDMGPNHLRVHMPDNVPFAEIARTDARGNTFVSRVPVMPGVYNSSVNSSHYNGVAKIVNEVGSLVFKATAVGAAGSVLGAGVGAIPK